MNIEEMKAFAALTDEEREKKIKIEEAKKKAEEDFYSETFNGWNGFYKEKTANCGCGDTYWMIADEHEMKNMCFCFDKYGKIGSAWEDTITLGSLTCCNCGEKPKMPKWYVEEYLGDEE